MIKLGLLKFEISVPLLDTSISYLMSQTDCVSLYVQILQGNARGHSGIWRHECRILRQRQTMATWNQPELWWCVPNIRWVCFLFWCPENNPFALFRLNSQKSCCFTVAFTNRFPRIFYFQWETRTTTPTPRWLRRLTRRSLLSKWASTCLRQAQKRTSMLKR